MLTKTLSVDHSFNVHDWTDLILCRMFCYDLKMGM